MGARSAYKSVAAMKHPRTKATVVKKPKTDWKRLRVLCMVSGSTVDHSTIDGIGNVCGRGKVSE